MDPSFEQIFTYIFTFREILELSSNCLTEILTKTIYSDPKIITTSKLRAQYCLLVRN